MTHQTDENHKKCLFYFYHIYRSYMVFNFQFAAKLTKNSLNQARNKLKNTKNSGTNLSVHDLYSLFE